jgi:hypothetical protein
MITKVVKYGLTFINNVWAKIENANIHTVVEDAIILDFETEQERDNYITENNIVIEEVNENL